MRTALTIGMLLVVALAGAARSAPMSSETFTTSARQEAAFLAQSSLIASRRASDARMRSFAEHEIGEQSAAFSQLNAWSAPAPAIAYADSLAAATPEMDSATPLAADTVLTGRSVAIDDKIGEASADMPAAFPGVIVMPRLESASGAEFDAIYRRVQTAALEDLAGLYAAYLESGDDLALRTIAMQNLPLVRARLARLETL